MRNSSTSRIEKRNGLRQNSVRQKLVAVLRLGDPGCLTAYLEETTTNVANDTTMLRNSVGALGMSKTLTAKHAQLYQ